MKSQSLGKYAFEFLSIFIAVISAFALNNWNDNRHERQAEEKILQEISNGIDLDYHDFSNNLINHQTSLRANQRFQNLFNGERINQDSLWIDYIRLFRDYTPVINQSGYESLKASGLKIIQNDSLRFKIIALYEYYYSIMVKVEEGYVELQSFTNYFKPINDILSKYMTFNEEGMLVRIRQPLKLSEEQKNEGLSYLWRLDYGRKYKSGRYRLVLKKMEEVKALIEKELEGR